MTTERSTTDRMLILACSQRKRSDEGLLPAVERYDGPAFRVLRRFLRGGSSKAPVVLILSAEHGLIPHDLPIAAYDRRMTPARARELRPLVLAELDRMIDSCSSPEILVVAGRQYLPALNADEASPLRNATIKICAGTMGRKLAELHDWLHGHPPELRYNSTMLAEGDRVRIRGVEVSLTSEQVFDVAADALAEGWGDYERYESWCVPVNDRCVAPKWLVSRISGVHAGDHYVYPDCRPQFIEIFDAMERRAVEGFGHPELRLHAPFVNKTKAQIVEVGATLSVPYEDTWSCYEGGDLHCGLCGTCNERKEAFEVAGVFDPTRYRD